MFTPESLCRSGHVSIGAGFLLPIVGGSAITSRPLHGNVSSSYVFLLIFTQPGGQGRGTLLIGGKGGGHC